MKTATMFLAVILAWPALGQDSNSPPDRGKRGGARGFGRPIELKEDDKPAFPEPPAGWDERREGIPHGKLELIEYESKTVGTRRKMQVYTPPGHTNDQKYPVLSNRG